jgi:segregation and condensation protein B
MDATEIKYFVEAALLAAGRPLNIDQIKGLFDGRMAPEKSEIRAAIAALNDDYEERGIVVSEVASGFRMEIKTSMSDRLQKLWEERPPRYSRALFETLALIAYRQPITRGEIEEIRGVAVSSNIVRQLLERDWARVVGHRDVPGRPAMFGTTKVFLDYFGLKKLDDLPPLADLSDWESLRVQLNLPEVEGQTEGGEDLLLDGPAEQGEQPEPGLEVIAGSEDLSEEGEEVILEGSAQAHQEEALPELGAIADESIPELTEQVGHAANDVPVLFPEGHEEKEEEIEELIVSEWPDPVG